MGRVRTNTMVSHSRSPHGEGRGRAATDTVLQGAQPSSGRGSHERVPRSPIRHPLAAGEKQTVPKALRGIFDPVFVLQNGLDVRVGDDNVIQF